MKNTLTLLTLLIACFSTKAQINSDSLLNAWQNEQNKLSSRSDALQDLIWENYMFSRPDSAIFFGQQGLQVFRDKDYPKGVATCYNMIGVANHVMGELDSAIYFYQHSLKIRKSQNDSMNIAKLLGNINKVYFSQAKYQTAMDYLDTAMTYQKELGMMGEYAGSLNSLGNIHQELGEFDQAMTYYEKGLELRKELGDQRKIAISLANIASMELNLRDYTKAVEHAEQCREAFEKSNDLRNLSTIYGLLGIIYQDLGNHSKALEYQLETLELRRKMGFKSGQAITLVNIGTIHQHLHDLDSAEHYYQEGFNLYQEIEDPFGEIYALRMLASVHRDRKQYEKGFTYARQALELARKVESQNAVGNSLMELSKLHYASQQLDSCKVYLEQIAHINESDRNLETELSSYRLSYSTNLEQKNYSDASRSMFQILEKREEEMRLNFYVLPEVEKELYLKKIASDFNYLYSYTAAHGQKEQTLTGKCYDYSLLMKGLLLKSSTAIRFSIQNSEDSLIAEKYGNWLNLKKNIAKKLASGEETKKLEEEANELEKQLIKESKIYASLNKEQHLNWKDVQKNLNENDVAIEFVRYASNATYRNKSAPRYEYAALLITAQSSQPSFVYLCSEDSLKSLIGGVQSNNLDYVQKLYGSRKDAKSSLYQLIWKPLEVALNGAENVYFSPVGLLHKISFAALSPSQEVFLCDQHRLQSISSTSKLALNDFDSSHYHKHGEHTLFGGIQYNSTLETKEIWSYLEGSEAEIESIGNILEKSGAVANYFKQTEATEGEFKNRAAKSTLLHIATHGFFFQNQDIVLSETIDSIESNTDLTFRGGRGVGMSTFVNNRNPLMRSGLIFAGANDGWNRSSFDEEDGILTAAEVATIDMQNTQLVVLSACETGLGDIRGSEGVYGLQRAFKMAGVKYLIMSLWQVPDKETAEFMTLFYKNLMESNDINTAFQKAQASMRKKYDPYYWAAFVLVE